MLNFFIDNFDFIVWFFGLILFFISGYCIGALSAIKDDIKSLDYDRIVAENNLLRDSIEIKNSKKR